MDTNEKPQAVADDVVVRMDYTLTIDGEIVDSSEEDEPLEFLQGHENIIPGLEQALYGMKVGDSKEVTVLSKDGYGPVDPDAVMEVPRDQFPSDIPMEEGLMLQVRDTDGELMDARIAEIKTDVIKLDFNHPLAGQDLHFSVKVVELRQPTPEELEHGHVHDDHNEEFEDEYDEDFDDEFEDEEEAEDEE